MSSPTPTTTSVTKTTVIRNMFKKLDWSDVMKMMLLVAFIFLFFIMFGLVKSLDAYKTPMKEISGILSSFHEDSNKLEGAINANTAKIGEVSKNTAEISTKMDKLDKLDKLDNVTVAVANLNKTVSDGFLATSQAINENNEKVNVLGEKLDSTNQKIAEALATLNKTVAEKNIPAPVVANVSAPKANVEEAGDVEDIKPSLSWKSNDNTHWVGRKLGPFQMSRKYPAEKILNKSISVTESRSVIVRIFLKTWLLGGKEWIETGWPLRDASLQNAKKVQFYSKTEAIEVWEKDEKK